MIEEDTQKSHSDPTELDALDSDEEFDKETDARMPKWSELKFIPNKKRFWILTLIFSVIQIAGIMVFTYAFLKRDPQGYFDFGIFIMAPFTGVVISYLVTSKKEAIAVSGVTGSISIAISLLIYILVEVLADFPNAFVFNIFTHFAIPVIFLLLEIAAAFTLARIQRIYDKIGDSSIPTERDKAMIEELRQSRIARGLEEPEKDELKSE